MNETKEIKLSTYSKYPVKANVMSQDEMIKRVVDVTKVLAEVIGSTIGPCGQNTLIQTMDKIIKTKDGYNIASNVDFDTYLDNSIRSLVLEVAKVIVDLVGDGSSSSIISSAYILENLYTSLYGKVTIREMEDKITQVIDMICEDIYANATKLTEENTTEIISKIALVATNWNKELATAIAEIYDKTGNPIIKLLDGNSNSTHVVIMEDSYDLAGQIIADDMINDINVGGMTVEKPLVMIFNHTVSIKKYALLSNLANTLYINKGQKLCVLAPGFDAQFIQLCKDMNARSLAAKGEIGCLIPIKTFRTNDYDRDCIDDFALLCGCNVISPENEDLKFFAEECEKVVKELSTSNLQDGDTNRDQLLQDLSLRIGYTLQFLEETFGLGTVDVLSATKSEIKITGTNEKMKQRIDTRIANLQSEIDAIDADFKNKGETAVRVKMKKQRLGKLKCKMGIIYVGGYGQADLKSKRDALDDAIRACETVFVDGYVTEGSSLSIPHAIKRIQGSGKVDDEVTLEIISSIYSAFIRVFELLINNKKPLAQYLEEHDLVVEGIVLNTMTKEGCYAFDILKDEIDYSRNVINPARTDTEILKAAMRIVLAGLTSNQLLYKRFDQVSE